MMTYSVDHGGIRLGVEEIPTVLITMRSDEKPNRNALISW